MRWASNGYVPLCGKPGVHAPVRTEKRRLPRDANDVGAVPACEALYLVKSEEVYVPCGSCAGCRSRRAREVQHRIVMEAADWPADSMAFVTLTYANECIPSAETRKDYVLTYPRSPGWKTARRKRLEKFRSSGADGGVTPPPRAVDQDRPVQYEPPPGSLFPRDVVLFLKRLRHDYGRPIRYYLAGEYDKRMRPHYHLILFGFPPCRSHQFRTQFERDGRTSRCCASCKMLELAWQYGRVDSEPVRSGAALGRYLGSYLLKGNVVQRKDQRESGFHAEYQRWSRRPMLGEGVLKATAETWLRHGLDALPDVPRSLAYARGREMPLPKHYRRILRELTGKPREAPAAVTQEFYEHGRAAAAAAVAYGTTLPAMARVRAATVMQRRRALGR